MSASSPRPIDDPAADAALLLIRIGLAILAIAVPVTAVVSRRALFTLLPVGAGLLLVASTLLPRPAAGRRLTRILGSGAGIAGLALMAWSGASLIWTPFPVDAAQRWGKEAGTIVFVVLAIAFLPERTRTSNLYLFPIGMMATAFATAAAAVLGPQALGAFQDADPTLERAVIGLIVMVWPALGALAVRDRWASAGWLAATVTIAGMTAWTSVALTALAFGAVAFAAATFNPVRIGRVLGVIAAILLLFAPALPLLLAPVAEGLSDSLGGRLPDVAGAAAALRVWANLIALEPLRLITGHGLDMAARAGLTGYLPPGAPRSLAFEIWYDLGLLGAVTAAAAAAWGFAAAGRTSATVAPFLLAEIVTGMTIALWGLDTTELWWVTLLGVAVLAFGNVVKGQYRTDRPHVRVAQEMHPPERQAAR